MAFDKLSKNVIWSFIHQFSYQIISLIVTVIFSRILFPSDVGLMAMTAVFYTIGERLSEAGLGSSLIRTKEVTNTDYNTVFFSNVFLSFGFYIVLFLFAPFVAAFFSHPILTNIIRINSLSFIILAFGSVQMTILVKELQFKKLGIISVISTIVGSAIGIMFALKGYGVWSLVINLLVGQSARNIILWYTSSWKPKFEFCKEKFKYHFNFGYKIALANIIDAIFSYTYIGILGKRFTPTTVGLYSRADSIKTVIISSVFGPLLRVLYPYFSEKQDDDNLDFLLRKSMYIIFALTTPLLLLMGVLAEPVFNFLFGIKWIDSVPIFQLICLAAILFPLESFNEEILKVKSRSDLVLKAEVFKKSIIIIALFFAYKYSIYILLYTQIGLSLATFSVNAYFTKKVFKISIFEQLKIIIPILFISGLTATVVYFINIETSNLFNFVRIAIGFSSGMLIYYFLGNLFNINALKMIKQIIDNKFFIKKDKQIELPEIPNAPKNKKLSIIIPVYNVEKYLERCFNSIVENTHFKNFEVIFVNDGSTDSSFEIINQIKNNHSYRDIKIINQENKGLAVTRNVGIENATGDYLLFLDSDDYIENYKINWLFNKAANDNLDLIGYDYLCIDSENNIINQNVVHKLKYNTVMTGQRALATGFQPASACLYLYKREFIIQNKLYFVPNLYMEDVEFTVRIMLYANKVYFTNYKAYIYFFSDESIKRTQSQEKIHRYLLDQIEVAKHIKNNINTCPNLSDESKNSILLLANKGVFSLLYVMLVQNPTIKIKFVKQCFRNLKAYNLYPLTNKLDSNFQRLLRPIFNNKKLYILVFKSIKKIK
jgi:teichuronic acid exporter